MSVLKTAHRIRHCSLLLISLTAIRLGACGTGSPSISASPTEETQRLRVITTFIPVTNFTKAVVGDRAEVTQLLPTNVGPHDYQAKPEDVQKLASGLSIFYLWVKTLKTDTGIRCCELPIYRFL